MKAGKLIAAIAVFTSALALPSLSVAQETPPEPPSNFVCNGVTCEGWIVVGYDPIDGSPEYAYVVFPDTGSEAPYPP